MQINIYILKDNNTDDNDYEAINILLTLEHIRKIFKVL